MLGKYGETLVVDWGLAKTGSSSSSRDLADEATFMPLSGDSSTQTRMGSVVGTPAYMSPEQAEGKLDALGPATDVYGLGATMYSILTGLPPVSNFSGKDILERVRTGQITPPRECNPDIPEALQAICLKALATNQTDRYVTSAALADDLELWLSDESVLAFREPWIDRAARYVRRHRTAAISSLAVLLTAILALLIINVLVRQQNNDLRIARDTAECNRQEAVAAKSKAEESRNEAIVQKNRAAENLVVARLLSLSMLNTAEERLSAPAITSDIALSLRMMLTEQAFTNFQSLYEQNRDDSELAYEFAQTSRISANLKRLLRDFKTADDRIENSLQIQLQSPPDQLTLKRKDYLAETYRDIATLRRAEGRLADAELALSAGFAIVKELQAAEPDNPNFMRTLAVGEVEQIGLHSDRMELDMALQKAISSAATFQKLIDNGQSNARDPILLLLAQARQIKLLYELGRRDEAKALATTLIPSGRQWQSKRLGDENIALPVARILYWSAEGLVNAEGPSEDATARVVEALGIFEELVKKRLQSGYLYGKGDTLRVQAKILRLQKMFKDAENSLVQSRTVLETLVKAADKGDNRDILAKTLHEFSMLKLAENEKHSAVEFLKEAVDMQKEACRLSPESLELKTHLQELTLELKSLKAEF